MERGVLWLGNFMAGVPRIRRNARNQLTVVYCNQHPASSVLPHASNRQGVAGLIPVKLSEFLMIP